MTFTPDNIVLRCLALASPRGTWVAKCVDLDLVAEEPTLAEAQAELASMIASYLDTVLASPDKPSIPALLLRKGPWQDRLLFSLLYWWSRVSKGPRRRLTFKQYIPMHLGAACH